MWAALEASMGVVPVRDAKWPRPGEAGDVADVGEDPRRPGGADAVDVHQG